MSTAQPLIIPPSVLHDLAGIVSPEATPVVKEAEPVKEEKEPVISVGGIKAFITSDGVAIDVGAGEKVISHAEFLDKFEAAMGRTATKERGVFLKTRIPLNTFYLNVGQDSVSISMYYPEGVKTTKYRTKKADRLMPNIIVSHHLVKSDRSNGDGEWRRSDTRLFCTDAPLSRIPSKHIWNIDNAGHIFKMPFPNTYTDGRVCWGENSIPAYVPKENLGLLNRAYDTFIESIFNDDLGNPTIGSHSIPGWFDHLQSLAEGPADKRKFPYNLMSGYSSIQPLANADAA